MSNDATSDYRVTVDGRDYFVTLTGDGWPTVKAKVRDKAWRTIYHFRHSSGVPGPRSLAAIRTAEKLQKEATSRSANPALKVDQNAAVKQLYTELRGTER